MKRSIAVFVDYENAPVEKQVIVFARPGSSSSKLKKLSHEFYSLEQLPQLLSNQSNNVPTEETTKFSLKSIA